MPPTNWKAESIRLRGAGAESRHIWIDKSRSSRIFLVEGIFYRALEIVSKGVPLALNISAKHR
jgi:hypothetical protein